MLVLIVDDTADLRRLVAVTLDLQGFRTAEAAGGRAALALLEDGLRPDVILLDVQMPDMDGWATLTAIRSDPATADIPVIFCTVKSRPEDLLRGWELGCDGYISKPFDADRLGSELARVSARSAVERRAVRGAELAVLRRGA